MVHSVSAEYAAVPAIARQDHSLPDISLANSVPSAQHVGHYSKHEFSLRLPGSGNASVSLFQDHLVQVFQTQGLCRRLESRLPVNLADVHVVVMAAAFANTWVLVDRLFQGIIQSLDVDFCTLVAAVHIVLERLPPYQHEEYGSSTDSEDDHYPFFPHLNAQQEPIPHFIDPPLSAKGQVAHAVRATTDTARVKASRRASHVRHHAEDLYDALAQGHSKAAQSGRQSILPQQKPRRLPPLPLVRSTSTSQSPSAGLVGRSVAEHHGGSSASVYATRDNGSGQADKPTPTTSRRLPPPLPPKSSRLSLLHTDRLQGLRTFFNK